VILSAVQLWCGKARLEFNAESYRLCAAAAATLIENAA